MERKTPGIDLAGLTAWLAGLFPDRPVQEPQVRLIAGGRSNLTYEIVHNGRSMVLRRPPLGHVLATAHDMLREYTVLTALAPTPVPVPDTLAYCGDETVIGAPFYLMAKVDGVVYRDAPALRALSEAAGQALGAALADTLAALHTVVPDDVGLGDFGRPEGFLDRQIRRWRKQLAASWTRDLPGAEELAERLAKALPDSGRPAVVHGDFRLDNALVDPDSHRIAAVLDWEMATLGDPLTDLGLTCVYWDGLDELNESTPPSPGGLPGWPSRADLVERYAAASGVAVGNLDWYVAFAYFKLAVILEGIYCRYTQGLTVGEGFGQIGAVVPELLARGHTALG